MTIRSVAIFANPAAGRGKARRLLARLELDLPRAGISTYRQILTLPPPGDGAIPAPLRFPEGTDAAIAIGGDGTLNSVVNAIDPGKMLVIAVPAGTSNSVARELGLPAKPGEIMRMVADGCERRMDAIEWRTGDGRPRLAVLCVSAGFDAAVVHEVCRARMGTSSYFAYAMPILRTLRDFPFAEMAVEADGRRVDGGATTVIVCNTRHYGGPLVAAPSASAGDGILDVCVIRARSRTSMVSCGLRALFGRADRSRHIEIVRGKQFRFTPAKPLAIPMQVDGEAAPALCGVPFAARCLPGAVRFLVPKTR